MKKHRDSSKQNNDKPRQTGHYLYPVFLILFILTTLFLFIFGSNGFYSHKRKLELVARLKIDNAILQQKLDSVRQNLDNIHDKQHVAIEMEARKASYKKPGDILIKLYHNDWIERVGRNQEKNIRQMIENPSVDNDFIDEHKGILALMICAFLATILTFILSKKKSVASKV